MRILVGAAPGGSSVRREAQHRRVRTATVPFCLIFLMLSCTSVPPEPAKHAPVSISSSDDVVAPDASREPRPIWVDDVKTICFDALTVTTEPPHSPDAPNDALVAAAVKRVLQTANVVVEQPPCRVDRPAGTLAMTVTFSQFTPYTSYTEKPNKLALAETNLTCSFPIVAITLTMSAPGRRSFSYVFEPERRAPRVAARCETVVSHRLTWQKPVLAALAEVWGDPVIAAAMLDVVKGGIGFHDAAEALRETRDVLWPVAMPFVVAGLKSDEDVVVEASAIWAAEATESSSELCTALMASLQRHGPRPTPSEKIFEALDKNKCLERSDLRGDLVQLAMHVLDGAETSSDSCSLPACGLWKDASRLLGRAKAKESLGSLSKALGRVFPREPTPVLLETIGEVGVTAEVADKLATTLARRPWSERNVALVRKWGPLGAGVLCGAIGSDEPDVRSQARALIAEAGEQALPCLKRSAHHRNPEIRSWARATLRAER